MKSFLVAKRLREELQHCRVVVIIGDSGVGKTYVSKQLQETLHWTTIETSDVVKTLIKTQETYLDMLENTVLLQEILLKIKQYENVILCGLREKYIVDTVKELCKDTVIVLITTTSKLHNERLDKRRDITKEKMKHDSTFFNYKQIPYDIELKNNTPISFQHLFTYEKFREVVNA